MNPRESALSRPVALRLAATEYDRCTELFRSLSRAQWARPTDCPAWDVRQMAAHMLGMVEMAASIRENMRQQRKAAQAGGAFLDALTQLQVDERADWMPERITERYAARAPKAVTGRRRTPGFVRGRTIPQLQDVNGSQEPWTFGYLVDVILTRDPWMHRMDIAAATGTPPRLTADHDGVIVADVVAPGGTPGVPGTGRALGGRRRRVPAATALTPQHSLQGSHTHAPSTWLPGTAAAGPRRLRRLAGRMRRMSPGGSPGRVTGGITGTDAAARIQESR